MAGVAALRYRAFISYSHADTKWAKALHGAIEGFRVDKDLVGRETATGPIPTTLRPVFRDRDEFTAGHTLGEQTVAALDASAALIVVCSPSATSSKYVNEEIRLFKARHPERPVIPVIVAGAPGGGDQECFPPALRFKLGADGQITDTPEPDILAADVHESGDGRELAHAKVIARLLGLGTDDIFRRAERERRRRARVRNAIVSAFAILCIAGGVAFWDSQRKGETIQTHEERERKAIALAKQLEKSRPAGPAAPGQEEDLIALLERTLAQADAGDDTAAKVVELVEQGKIKEAIDVRVAAAERRKQQAETAKRQIEIENKEAARELREAAALAAVAQPWRARELYAEAARLDPDDIDGLLKNAWFQQEAGELGAAETAYRNVVAFGKTGTDDSALYWAHLGLGDIVMARGDLDGAKSTYSFAKTIAGRLAAADPKNAGWQRDLSVSYNKVGDVLVAQGDLAAALKAFEDGRTIAGRLAAADPKNAGWQRDLSVSYNKVGDVLVAQGDLAAALKAFEDGRTIAGRLAAADPKNAGWQRDLAISHGRVARVLGQTGETANALAAFRKGREVIARLRDQSPDNATLPNDLAWFDANIAAIEEQ